MLHTQIESKNVLLKHKLRTFNYSSRSLLYAIAKIAFITARIIASLGFISAVHMIHFIYHFIVDSFLTALLELTNDQLPTSVAS